MNLTLAAAPAPQSMGGCRLFQLGFTVDDIDTAVAQFSRLFGAQVIDLTYDLRDSGGAETMIQALGHLGLGAIEVELIQPRQGWPSVYTGQASVSPAAARLHHFGYLAANDAEWDAATQLLAGQGIDKSFSMNLPTVRFAYYNTGSTIGIYTEIVQRI